MWLVLANFKMSRLIRMKVMMIRMMTMMIRMMVMMMMMMLMKMVMIIKMMVMRIRMGQMLIFSTPKWPKLNFRDPPLFFPVDTEERMQEDKATQTGGM